ncbi:FRG domain-containing protein [Glutamicibacter sp. MNS18]|uniref:FRG domain-containing protein n=1 Tax=Glutamicibacter sp. MNS18 TaxID=2989817 RepID=UPI0022358E6A|nr:FRG domain-containing protein [Glutamicibacter sp. MNS18]MCW4466126.1 FRG domain-containing protein [Glutamicibacter sp. MNS18]
MGKGNQPPKWQHSAEYESPASVFKGHEDTVGTLDELWTAMNAIQSTHRSRLLWRGQANHCWGLHSSLFRTLRNQKYDGVFTAEKHITLQREETDLKPFFPTENEMNEAEVRILTRARSSWRLDSLNAMEIFARVQHRGGPTRLIDFSFNPLVALWFAVSDNSHEEVDARLFCLALKGPSAASEEPNIRLDSDWGGYQPEWHKWKTDLSRREHNWGTGSLRRFWIPPIYDDRMLAQNSVFVIDGIPISDKVIQSSFRKVDLGKNNNWKMADLLSSGSLYLKFYRPGQENKTTMRNFASTYTLRVPASAKPTLRRQLDAWFGYDASSIYPDVDGLRQDLVQEFSAVVS